MSKFKESSHKPKIPAKPSACPEEQYPHFSFRYMTTNNRYSISSIEKLDTSQQSAVLNGLVRRMEEITKNNWVFWGNQRKGQHGYETIPQQQLRFSGTYPLTEDAKLIVFRFDTHLGKGCGRIIGFKKSPCSAYYVIGFDLGYNAYNHGS